MSFASVGGPAFVMDAVRGRCDGAFAEMCDDLRLVQSPNILHQEGGGPSEPMDLPANTRHLDIYLAQVTLMDKSCQTQTLCAGCTMDGIGMAALSQGEGVRALRDLPVLVGIINTNSSLQLDVPMAKGLVALVGHGRVNVITPFTLAGAMTPVTLAGAGLVPCRGAGGHRADPDRAGGRPGDVGGFPTTSTCAPARPPLARRIMPRAAQASGQLARDIGVAVRSSNVPAANTLDAQAACMVSRIVTLPGRGATGGLPLQAAASARLAPHGDGP